MEKQQGSEVLGQFEGHAVLRVVGLTGPFLGIAVRVLIFEVGDFFPISCHNKTGLSFLTAYIKAPLLVAPGAVAHMDRARNLFRGCGDDIDDTAHGVSPIYGGSTVLDDFNMIDQIHRRQRIGIKGLPRRRIPHTGIDAAAIHEEKDPFFPIKIYIRSIGAKTVSYNPYARYVFKGVGNGTAVPVRQVFTGNKAHIGRCINLLIFHPVCRNDNFLHVPISSFSCPYWQGTPHNKHPQDT